MEKTDQPQVQARCNSCVRETAHILVATDLNSGIEVPDPCYPMYYHEMSEMLKCCGCGDVIFRKRSWTDADVHILENGEEIVDEEIEYFPPAISRPIPRWHWRLSNDLRSLLGEIYAALHQPSTRLAAMGTRSALDIVLLEKVGGTGSFAQKLDALVTDGHATQAQRDLIETALDAGSAAIHRGHVPKSDDVEVILDIVENVLHRVYILPDKAEQLRKSTPPRPKRE